MNITFKKLVMAAVAAAVLGGAYGRDDEVWLKATVEGQPFKGGHLLNQQDDKGVAWIEDPGAWGNMLIKFEQQQKFDNHRIYDSESMLQAGYKFSPYFSAYIGDKYQRERKDHMGKMRLENRPTLDLCFTAPEFLTLKFDFRSRFELRMKSNADDYVRYRERLRLRTSWSVTDFKISPYASEEVFFSDKPHQSGSDAFDRTRTQVGLSFKPIPSLKDLSCNLYYMAQHSVKHQAQDWDPTSIIGLEFNWKF